MAFAVEILVRNITGNRSDIVGNEEVVKVASVRAVKLFLETLHTATRSEPKQKMPISWITHSSPRPEDHKESTSETKESSTATLDIYHYCWYSQRTPN
jgi:hypothetical protein